MKVNEMQLDYAVEYVLSKFTKYLPDKINMMVWGIAKQIRDWLKQIENLLKNKV